jgi:putative phage-type endonuclease
MNMEIEYDEDDSICESTNENESIETDSQFSIEWTSIFENMTEDDICNTEEHIKEYIDEYLKQMMLQMSSPYFYDTLVQEVSQTILEEWMDAGICSRLFEENHYDELLELVERLCIAHFEMCKIPLREEPTTDQTQQSPEEILPKLARIQSVDQAKQRTTEWYESRYNLLTASNLWKVFGSPAQYNSLIYEKCKPLEIHDRQNSSISVDSNSTLQHGIRYEPLSILLYEQRYGTKVCDVGCIPHPAYSYIGASPDGIIMDSKYSRYGRMIEVKNIVNREISGVPLESYWIQMQLQMEVCDLDECDFIETRFLPFENIESISGEDDDRQKGTILYFYPRSMIGDTTTEVSPEYAYLPLNINPLSAEADEWIKQQCAEHPRHILYKKSYWILDQFSCVLVRRNREWFCEALPKIEEAWNTILVERETGYDHRATNPSNNPNKKKKIQTEVVCSVTTTTHYIRNMPLSNSICLVKLGGMGEPMVPPNPLLVGEPRFPLRPPPCGETKVPPTTPSLWGNQGSP